MRAVINGEWTVYCILSFFFLSFFLFLTLCFFRQNDENTFGFETPSKSACKSLYKCCSQHLAFFRLVQMSGPLLTSATITATTGNHNNNSIGSKFLKLSGAAAPTTATVGQQSHSPPQFRRMPSRRHQRRIVDGASHRKTFFALFLFFFFYLLSLYLHPLFIPPQSFRIARYMYNHFCFVFGLPLSHLTSWWYLFFFSLFCCSCSCWFFFLSLLLHSLSGCLLLSSAGWKHVALSILHVLLGDAWDVSSVIGLA